MSLAARDYENYSYSIFVDDLVKLKSRQVRYMWVLLQLLYLDLLDDKTMFFNPKPYQITSLYFCSITDQICIHL